MVINSWNDLNAATIDGYGSASDDGYGNVTTINDALITRSILATIYDLAEWFWLTLSNAVNICLRSTSNDGSLNVATHDVSSNAVIDDGSPNAAIDDGSSNAAVILRVILVKLP